MNEQIEEIKRRIDIVQLISEYIPLKKAGRNFKALCPFHSETVPSFIVSPERQIWHCFGQCGEGGDIFKFLMKIENIDFGEALRELAKRAGVKLISYKPTQEERYKQLLYEINHLATEFYHYLLLNHPVGKRALNYILGRGIKRESLEKFKLGYAPRMWEGLQKFLIGKKGYKIEDLEKVGLVIKSERGRGYYDRFRDRLMFPLRDHRGNICGFAGRVLEKDAKEAKYINTPETLIYHKSEMLYGLFENKEEIKKANEAILVEGELDAISSWQTGVKNVVAIKGSALSGRQIQLLGRFTKNLVFALDSDIAGDAAAKRGIEMADSFGMAMEVIEIKGGKDPDEVAQKNPQLWRDLVKKAVPVYDYFLDSAFMRFDSQTAEGKRKIGQEIIPVLAKISDKIVQAHYIQILAERLEVDKEAVVSEVAKSSSSLSSQPAASSIRENTFVSKPRREILEEYLLGLCFQSGNWRWLRKKKVLLLVKTPRFLRILEILRDYFKKYKTLDSARLAKMLPSELLETFNKIYFLELSGLIEEEERLKEEFQETLYHLEKLTLREELKAVTKEIVRLEEEGEEEEKIEKLNQRVREIGKKLAELEEKE